MRTAIANALWLFAVSSCARDMASSAGAPPAFPGGSVRMVAADNLKWSVLLRRAASTSDGDERSECVQGLLDGAEANRSYLAAIIGDTACTPREKDIAAFVLLRSPRDAHMDALARYYVGRLQDPEYHTIDYLDPLGWGHRHGGFIRHKRDDGREIMVQVACPMDAIKKIGPYALPRARATDERAEKCGK